MMIIKEKSDILDMNNGDSNKSNNNNNNKHESLEIQTFRANKIHRQHHLGSHHFGSNHVVGQQQDESSLDTSDGDGQQCQERKHSQQVHQQLDGQQKGPANKQLAPAPAQANQHQLNDTNCDSNDQNKQTQSPAQSQQQQQQQGPDGKPKRNPYCSRCRNHGKSAQVKGHKRYCEYRDCQCEGCKLVECRQIVSAAQIKRRRNQKQDEECGRRIEVSPPVLTREPNNDPAALIAKTLIRSAKHNGSSEPPLASMGQKQLATGAAVSPVVGGQQHQLRGQVISLPAIHSAAAAATLAAAAVAASSASSSTSSSVVSNHHHHQHHHLTSGAASHHAHPLRVAGAAAAATAHLSLTNFGQHDTTGAAPTQTGAAALGDAYHLFHFPGSVLSAAAAASLAPPYAHHHHHHQQHPGASAAASAAAAHLVHGVSNNLTQTVAAPMLTIRDQFNLVKEIHQTYGPLAIYAWLRDEQFNLHRIHNSIELAKGPFDELLQMHGHSAAFGFGNRQTNS